MSAILLSDSGTLNLPKSTVSREDLQKFKVALQQYVCDIQNAIDNKENEEHLKNIINSFLLLQFYSNGKYTINTDGNIDSAIKLDGKLLAIIEAKTPYNKAEMLSVPNINRKALWEAVYYYLDRTVDTSKSKSEILHDSEIRRLIVTDGIHWFVFDSEEIYNVVKHKLRNIFFKYKNNKLSFANDNAAFYELIRQELDEQCVNTDLKYIYFDIRECVKKNNILTSLYKILSADFLLKTNNYTPYEARSLNSRFYHELLYIMGLRETEKENRQVIERDSSIENSLTDQVYNDMRERDLFGDEVDEKSFELVLIWVNRLLFIKLFEGQLISFNSNSYEYQILTKEKISSFEELNKLFFEVLGKKNREESEFQLRFKDIPYLNSSLFEVEDAERDINTIRSLKNNAMRRKPDSVLGKKAPAKIPVLDYIIDFLNSYNFSSSNDELEDSKEIIDSAVLGWFFEKLNGYKDGAFFTPDVITDYLARESVESAVIAAVNKEMNWRCNDLIDIKNEISGRADRRHINDIINSLKICDPSVGSGHFLVSVLNRMIAVKKQLGVLFKHNSDELIKEYEIDIENHILTVRDGDGKAFSYNRSNNESREIQETLFNEKCTIIENCLFGVDINPKAVHICRLRLWIELLKNAYYKNGVMDTLPNIDINIKSGNSLIYQLGFEHGKRIEFKKSGLSETDVKTTLNSLRSYIREYYSIDDKSKKKEIRKYIRQLRNNLTAINSQQTYFEEEQAKKDIYFNAEEWLLDFPHLIDENLNFCGFDIVIGNPPYIQLQGMKDAQKYQKTSHKFSTFTKTGDIYCLFYELALRLLKDGGILAYITSNKWMRAGYGELLREFLAKNTNPTHLIDFAGEKVFGSATVDVNIYICRKETNRYTTKSCIIKGSEWRKDLSDYFEHNAVENSFDSSQSWVILSPIEQSIKRKIEAIGTP
ncbi:MAG: class I SAM-dependent DNA methyltransferase, partial [Ruminococcaceae bacterium]|nr:class I SAM-dependent DNA methyltransferase [Oscillospiraceae bacterium]